VAHPNGKAPPQPKVVRVAIYTRKSTEEGLDAEFNSLDAQRQAVEAYVASQRGEGWVALPERYDDGGYTGANTNRPAFQALLADIEAGKVDVVAVYKIDRLSRSLLDFVKIMEVFTQHGVTFTSVTQQFSTTTSIGKLTLNLLMSFAEFERQVISERTRDKMGASRRKGMWTGGYQVLGYNAVGKKLVVNQAEAERVRAIFQLYVERGSLLAVVTEVNQRGWTTKSWTNTKGKLVAGRPFDRNLVARVLTNPIYLGKMPYRDELHEGAHEAIVDRATWDAVQQRLKAQRPKRRGRPIERWVPMLAGLVKCGVCGAGMTGMATTRLGRRYCYYVCQSLVNRGAKACPGSRAPAGELERFVVERLKVAGSEPGGLSERLESVTFDSRTGETSIALRETA
jgi:site-specific DNA recombinase